MFNCGFLHLLPTTASGSLFDDNWVVTDLGVYKDTVRNHFIDFLFSIVDL